MKKLYYLADALTLCEVIAGVVLLIMAWVRAPANYAIWVFVGGELCDAFDGPCARRWSYPDDGKKRWWRTHVKLIEHASDIFIAVACMIFLMRVDDPTIRDSALLLGYGVILFCTGIAVCIWLVEYTRRRNKISILHRHIQKRIKLLILARRWVYAFGGVGGGIYLLITATDWPISLKIAATNIGVLVGTALLIYKLDRALNP